MRRFLIFLCILVCGLAIAAPPNGLTNRGVAWIATRAGSGSAGGGGGFSYSTSFEGSIEAGWSATGGTWGSADQAVDGTKSLKHGVANDEHIYTIGQTLTTYGVAFAFLKTANPSVNAPFIYRNTAGDGAPTLILNTDGTLTVQLKSGVTATTVTAIANSTWTYIKLLVTLTDAFVSISADKHSFPTSGNATATASGSGGVGGNVVDIYFNSNQTNQIFYDDLIVKDSDPAYP